MESMVRLGEYDSALRALVRLLSRPAPMSLELLAVDPLWRPLHDHPAFGDVLGGPPRPSSTVAPSAWRPPTPEMRGRGGVASPRASADPLEAAAPEHEELRATARGDVEPHHGA
jgi:hypothetical protein